MSQHYGAASNKGSLRELGGASLAVLLVVFIGGDLLADWAAGSSLGHMAGELLAVAWALGLLALQARRRKADRTAAAEVAAGATRAATRWRAEAADAVLDARQWRAEAERWRREAERTLASLGELLDVQFARWELSEAEREVALLLLKGLSMKELAEVRGTSERTARQQAGAVYKKANLSSRSELAAFFLEDLLTPVPRRQTLTDEG